MEQKIHDKNKVKLEQSTLDKICKEYNTSEEDVLYIVNYFKDFHSLTDDEILSVFDDEHPNHCEYSDKIELVFKKDANEMFLWIHDYKYAVNDLIDFIIPEHSVGKTLPEAYVYSRDNIITLSDGQCVFKYE